LVCAQAEEIIAVGRNFGTIGHKVNGAGGDGGSVTLLCDGDRAKKREMLGALQLRGYSHLPLYISRRGLRVW
jgi:D-glycero-alpha-D-manno-heptose-7-phosphate kinase